LMTSRSNHIDNDIDIRYRFCQIIFIIMPHNGVALSIFSGKLSRRWWPSSFWPR
jgi:hypothetical protein